MYLYFTRARPAMRCVMALQNEKRAPTELKRTVARIDPRRGPCEPSGCGSGGRSKCFNGTAISRLMACNGHVVSASERRERPKGRGHRSRIEL